MENFNKALTLMKEVEELHFQYTQSPKKRFTKEMRKVLTELKAVITEAKRDLILLDEQKPS
jgi:hypothetical protein